MSRFYTKSLNFRNRLFILFASISILPLAIVGIIVTTRINQNYRITLIDSFEKQASITKQNLLYFLESNRSYIQSLAAQDILLGEMERYVDAKQSNTNFEFDPTDTIYSTLVSVRRENNFIEKVYIVDTQGKILVSTATNDIGISISSDELFTNPVRTRSTYIGKVRQQTNERIIPLSTPFLRKNNNQVIGLLVIEVNTSIIKALFDGSLVLQTTSAYASEAQENAYVIDDDGYVLNLAQGKPVSIFPQEKCKNEGLDQVGEWKGINSEQVFGVSKCVRVSDFAWTLLVESPLSEAFILSRELTTAIFVVTVVVGALLLLLTIIVSRSVTEPIRILISGSKQLGRGELSKPIKIETKDEFQELAESFNDMANTLHSSFDKLTAERNKMEVILAGIQDAVIAVDLDYRIILFNKSAEDFLGFKASEVVDKNITQIWRVYDNTTELDASEYSPIRYDDFEGTVFAKRNLKIFGNNNIPKFAHFTAGKIKEGPRVNLGCIITLHDVTAEAELEEMKLDFVSMAAHELRTPLTSIRGYTDLLISTFSDKVDGANMQYLYKLATSAQNLSNLIDNLLSVSRIERGAFKVENALVDLRELIMTNLKDYTERATSKNQTLLFEDPDGPIKLVWGDSFRIGQVLQNLVNNAINYTPKGGKIVIKIENMAINNIESVAITVSDTGPGIPQSAIPKLFTKFFRVSGALEAGSKGTGLGLYICKSIVALHHGQIWVKSEAGHGAAFTFTIPVATEEQIRFSKESLIVIPTNNSAKQNI